MIIIGALLTVFGVSFIIEGSESQNWPTAEGEVSSIWVQTSTSDNGTKTYTYEVNYRYTVNDTSYTSDRFSLGGGSTASKRYNDEEEARAGGREAYPTGSLVLVSYDPQDPGSAVLDPGLNWGTAVPLILGLLFTIGGAASFYLFMRKT